MKYVTVVLLVLLSLALVVAPAVGQSSTPLIIGDWLTTPFFVQDGFDATFGPFTYSSDSWTRLRVVIACPTDQLDVYDNGAKVGQTPAPQNGSCVFVGGDEMWNNASLPKFELVLAPGSHSINFETVASLIGGGSIYLRWDTTTAPPTPPPSTPTSKDDCKNGGWQNYGFRNQGQCVSSVNH